MGDGDVFLFRVCHRAQLLRFCIIVGLPHPKEFPVVGESNVSASCIWHICHPPAMSVPEDRVLAIYMGVSFGAFQGSPVRATIVW